MSNGNYKKKTGFVDTGITVLMFVSINLSWQGFTAWTGNERVE